MTTGDFDAFKAQALAEGYDEVLERSWPADARFDEHSHPFALKAQMVRGEMWLSIGPETQHLCAGARFELAGEVLHAELYGHEGATYWVARRNPR